MVDERAPNGHVARGEHLHIAGADVSLASLEGRNGSAKPSKRLAGPRVAHLVREVLASLGEDPEREGLKDTPERVARSLGFLTDGYRTSPQEAVGDALFEEPYDDLVLVRDVEFYSLCEHHLLPFFGRVHIGYVPNGRIIGLSKLPRLVDVFARRLQVQERLTREIAEGIEALIEPAGVGVVVEASHLCMMMRGVQKQRSTTVTSSFRGTLREDASARAELLALARRPVAM